MGGDGLVALGPESEYRHRVAVPTHCEARGEFVQVAAEGQVMEQEVSVRRRSRWEDEAHLGI